MQKNKSGGGGKPAQKATPRREQKIDSGLFCFVTLAHFHGLNANADQLRHAYAINGEGMRTTEMLRAAKDFGFKAKSTQVEITRLHKMTLPAILEKKDGQYFVLAKADAEKFLVLFAGEQAPKVLTRDELSDIWTGHIILLAQRFWKENTQGFGFKWFIPTIIKYKKPLINVLVAVFVLQILGLFSPMIMQVVIDKVLTHHSASTLDVLAFALIVVAIFETLLAIAKNYIFTHTTSRIDVMLGARLFRHLFALPLRYFEMRRVGDTTARVRELENIRQFLTGSPLTSVLDVLFVVVYLAVMMKYLVETGVIH